MPIMGEDRCNDTTENENTHHDGQLSGSGVAQDDDAQTNTRQLQKALLEFEPYFSCRVCPASRGSKNVILIGWGGRR